jgi:hypothetical protein
MVDRLRHTSHEVFWSARGSDPTRLLEKIFQWSSPVEVGGTNAPASAKPAEAHPPMLTILAINEAIRSIANTALADTLSAFIRQLKLAAFCEGG